MASAPPSPSLSAVSSTSSSSSSSSSPPPSQKPSARFAREYYNNRPSISTVIGAAPTTPTMEQASPHVFVLPSAAKGKAPAVERTASTDAATSSAQPSSSKPAPTPVVFGVGAKGRPQLMVSPGASMPSPILRPSAPVSLAANRRSVGPNGVTSSAAAPSLRGYTASDWSLLAIQRTSVGLLITLQHRPSEALFAWPMNTVAGGQTGPGQVYITPKSPDPKDAPAPTTTSWSLRVLGDVVSAWVRGPGKQTSNAAAGKGGRTVSEGSGKRRLGEHESDVLELAQQLGLHALPEEERRSTLARQKIDGVTVIPSPATTPGTGPGEAPKRNEAAAAALAAAREVAPFPKVVAGSAAPDPATQPDVARAPKKKDSFSALRALKGLRPSSAAGLVSTMTGGGSTFSRRDSRRTASTTDVPKMDAAAAATVTNSGSSSSASSIGSIFSTTKRPSSSRMGSTDSAISSIPTIEISEEGVSGAVSEAPTAVPASSDPSATSQAGKERSARPFSLTAWNSSASSLLKGGTHRPRRGSSNSSIATTVAQTPSSQRSEGSARTQITA